MPDAPTEMVDTIFCFNSGVNLLMISFLSLILSVIYSRRSDSDADIVIRDASTKVWKMSSLFGRLVTKSLVDLRSRVSNRGSKSLLSFASHSSRASASR